MMRFLLYLLPVPLLLTAAMMAPREPKAVPAQEDVVAAAARDPGFRRLRRMPRSGGFRFS
ncbi:hypothetical protein GCM10020258_25980 [Sphingomonas yabuuchiae]